MVAPLGAGRRCSANRLAFGYWFNHSTLRIEAVNSRSGRLSPGHFRESNAAAIRSSKSFIVRRNAWRSVAEPRQVTQAATAKFQRIKSSRAFDEIAGQIR